MRKQVSLKIVSVCIVAFGFFLLFQNCAERPDREPARKASSSDASTSVFKVNSYSTYLTASRSPGLTFLRKLGTNPKLGFFHLCNHTGEVVRENSLTQDPQIYEDLQNLETILSSSTFCKLASRSFPAPGSSSISGYKSRPKSDPVVLTDSNIYSDIQHQITVSSSPSVQCNLPLLTLTNSGSDSVYYSFNESCDGWKALPMATFCDPEEEAIFKASYDRVSTFLKDQFSQDEFLCESASSQEISKTNAETFAMEFDEGQFSEQLKKNTKEELLASIASSLSRDYRCRVDFISAGRTGLSGVFNIDPKCPYSEMQFLLPLRQSVLQIKRLSSADELCPF